MTAKFYDKLKMSEEDKFYAYLGHFSAVSTC